jgi:hypothetical protein
MDASRLDRRVTTALGLLLVAAGLILFLLQTLGVRAWSFAWTLFIIVPGLAFFAAMALIGRRAAYLAIPGSVITTTGLILLYQALTNLWQSWAYAWALVAPTAVGVGLMIAGAYGGQPSRQRAGQRLAALGVVLFLIGFVFFELVLNFSGLGGGVIGVVIGPALLIAAGVALLLSGRARGAKGEG